MKHATTPVFDMLHSLDFFTDLRTALAGVGLGGEEKFGVGVYFAAASRFFQNPLRLCVQEQTDGGANYVVRRVAKLLQPGSFVELPSDSIEAWRGFREKPAHKVLYLPDGDGAWGKENSTRFEITQNQISRVVPVRREGRVVEEREDIETAFACISTEHRDWMRDTSRWLTMLLEKPPQQTGQKANSFFSHPISLDEEQIVQWHRLQDLIQERAQLGIVLPDWADVVIEETCKDERASRHLSAYLQASDRMQRQAWPFLIFGPILLVSFLGLMFIPSTLSIINLFGFDWLHHGDHLDCDAGAAAAFERAGRCATHGSRHVHHQLHHRDRHSDHQRRVVGRNRRAMDGVRAAVRLRRGADRARHRGGAL